MPRSARLVGVLLVLTTLISSTSAVTDSAHATGGPRAVVTYSIGTAGGTHTDVDSFARHVAATLATPDGWTLGGSISFTRVTSNPQMRILLTAPAVLGGISGCDSTWSCRVGVDVYINETRWNQAAPTWTLGLDAYRHYVVNHEVGHFLGFGHVGCPGAGHAAPVMMQQSKGSSPCHDNVWPLANEREQLARRYGVPIRVTSPASLSYVGTAYLRILQRWPTAAELADRAMRLDDGSLTRVGLLASLFADRQFQTVPARVARLYQATFARSPDAPGALYWGGRLQHGYPARSMATVFASSGEFTTRYGALDDDAFVDLLYRHVLGRPGDAAGQRYWTDQLGRGSSTRGDVLLGLSESAEHRFFTRDEVLVTVAYTSILGVSPDPAGLDYWAGRLGDGTPLAEVLKFFRTRPGALL